MRPRLRIGLCGGGRAARALLARWAADRALTITVWTRRPAVARRLARSARVHSSSRLAALRRDSDVLVLAVSDDAVVPLARQLAAEGARGAPQHALHLAGAFAAHELLAPLAAQGVAVGVLHPMLPLTGAAIENGLAAVSGDRPAVRAARRLARAARLEPCAIAPHQHPLAHLACVLAAGDLTALLWGSQRWLREAGLSAPQARRATLALATRALENLARLGPERALTGPAVRGDRGTLAAHERALEARGWVPDPWATAHRALAGIAARAAAGRKRGAERMRLERIARELLTGHAPRTLRRSSSLRGTTR